MKFSLLALSLCLVSRRGDASTPSADSSGVSAKAKAPLRTVPHLDLHRYMGDWRVIANIPYFAEKGCVDSIEAYRLRPDGKIANAFTYRKGSFDKPQKQFHAVGEVYNKETMAEWRVRFFGLFSAKYFVTDLDPHYAWAVIAHPSRNYGWVLARRKTLPKETYDGIMARLAGQGYDPSRFRMVPQLPSQLPAH